MNPRRIGRRAAFHAAIRLFPAVMAAGCSSSNGSGKKRSRSRGKENRDPTRFGSMLMASYIDDLKSGSATKQVTAANELANMGSKATSALPTLEQLVKNDDEGVSAAAKAAIAAIRKSKKR